MGSLGYLVHDKLGFLSVDAGSWGFLGVDEGSQGFLRVNLSPYNSLGLVFF